MVELLVAMALSALAVTIALAVLIQVQHFYQKERIEDELENEGQRIGEFLRNDLRRAKQLVKVEGNRLVYISEDDETTVVFLRNDTLFRNGRSLSPYACEKLALDGEQTASLDSLIKASGSTSEFTLSATMILRRLNQRVSYRFILPVRRM